MAYRLVLRKRLHPWIVPGFYNFPPSPYSANAREWYNQGKEGFGGHYGIVPEVDFWLFWGEYSYFNFADGPGPNSRRTINPKCK